MNLTLVDPIAQAVLYEGYNLYPYRPSVKNRQRWTFGGLFPEAYCRAQRDGDASEIQTECLARGEMSTTVDAVVRFLHLTERQVGEVNLSSEPCHSGGEPAWRPVEMLRVGQKTFHTWQEAEERQAALREVTFTELTTRPCQRAFRFAGGRQVETLRDPDGQTVGILVRRRHEVEGLIEASAVEVSRGLFRLTVRVLNTKSWHAAEPASRHQATLSALVSAHVVLEVKGGEFVSLMDPPEDCRQAASACRNTGVYPVLVGEEGHGDMVLSSPIILYDYPRVAPESPGSFFDGTEIDEMLTLRVLTMTDDEKRDMAAVDDRTAALLERVQGLARDQLLSLHGAVRDARPLNTEETVQ
jgi:hydrogenase maturation protease